MHSNTKNAQHLNTKGIVEGMFYRRHDVGKTYLEAKRGHKIVNDKAKAETGQDLVCLDLR